MRACVLLFIFLTRPTACLPACLPHTRAHTPILIISTVDGAIFGVLALFWGLFHVWFTVTKRSLDAANADDNDELTWGLPSLGSTERQQRSQHTMSVGGKLTLLKLKVKGIGAEAVKNKKESGEGKERTVSADSALAYSEDASDSRDSEEPPPSPSSPRGGAKNEAKARGRGSKTSKGSSSRSRDSTEEESRSSSSTANSIRQPAAPPKGKANAAKAM